MKVILAGGTGLIGRLLSRRLAADGHAVWVLSRHPEKARQNGPITMVKWDGRTTAGWQHWVDEADAIVNLTGENIGGLQALRYGVFILFPLLVGWQTYGSTAVSDLPPTESRTIHPAPPGEYTGLSNPVPKTPENIMQGKGFYAAYCSPCHGGNFDGKGPAARGYIPAPANFADPTTIAMLQESYLFWRIKKGGIGLPIEGAPWKSAMPRWEVELPDEWIWKIIMGEYDGAHQSPRTWE